MSIVERAAEFRGPFPQTHPRHSGAAAATASVEPSLIERAISDRSSRPDPANDRNSSEGPRAEGRAERPAGKTGKMLKIDLEKLRQQSIVTPAGERTMMGESFRRIKRQILANVANPAAGVATNLVMVTSSLAGEGKTFCSANLAISIAMEMDRTVLLVDADVARPAVPRTLGIEVGKGLMDVLLDPSIDLADVMCRTDIEKLSILPAGTGHRRATELLASERMHALLEEMAKRYSDRVIIFDSPPLLAASEAAVLASRMGQIVMVVEAGKTSEHDLKDALRRIESCDIVGVVLNKGGVTNSGSYYGAYGA